MNKSSKSTTKPIKINKVSPCLLHISTNLLFDLKHCLVVRINALKGYSLMLLKATQKRNYDYHLQDCVLHDKQQMCCPIMVSYLEKDGTVPAKSKREATNKNNYMLPIIL